MPASHAQTVARCAICAARFVQWNSRSTCCSPECSRERKKRCSAAWYAVHAAEHIRAVLVRRRGK